MALPTSALHEREANARTAIGQSIFTIIAKADPLRIDAARAQLQRIDDAITLRAALPFDSFEMLHFCSFTIFDDASFGPILVFESNIDGAPETYLDALCTSALAGPVLHSIYDFCIEYQSNGYDPQYLRRYIGDRFVSAATAFVGNVGRSARRIRDEAALVEHVQDYLDAVVPNANTTADTIAADVRSFVRGMPQYDWLAHRAPRLTPEQRLSRWTAALGLVATALGAVTIAWLPFAVFVAVLRRHEIRDPIAAGQPAASQLRALSGREDQIVQNHMASLCYVKPCAFRRRTLKTILSAANIVARISTKGRLLGLDSLHFAQWALIDNDTRLLFLTNYDGSWENYLDDFIEKAALGLTAIWSNTRDFPRTRYLFLDGARDERSFKAIARKTQAYTNVWYSAYPALAVAAIEKNSAICDGLRPSAARFDAAKWLRLLN